MRMAIVVGYEKKKKNFFDNPTWVLIELGELILICIFRVGRVYSRDQFFTVSINGHRLRGIERSFECGGGKELGPIVSKQS